MPLHAFQLIFFSLLPFMEMSVQYSVLVSALTIPCSVVEVENSPLLLYRGVVLLCSMERIFSECIFPHFHQAAHFSAEDVVISLCSGLVDVRTKSIHRYIVYYIYIYIYCCDDNCCSSFCCLTKSIRQPQISLNKPIPDQWVVWMTLFVNFVQHNFNA